MMDREFLLESFATSDVGLVRTNNEDVFRELVKERFFVLADGMGGHKAGEIAAAKAVEYMCSEIQHFHMKLSTPVEIEELKSSILSFIENTNLWVHHLGVSDPRLKGMGTTLASVLFHQKFVIYSHVGDSRIYRFRRGKLFQLTSDHLTSSTKKILAQAVGTAITITPDIAGEVAEIGDIYLLCSDGLSDLVPFATIQKILGSTTDLNIIGKNLLHTAKFFGGTDNITLMLIRIL